jgi:hypothetical protein
LSLDPVTNRYENPAAIEATAAKPRVRYRRTPNGRRDRATVAGWPIAAMRGV